VPPSVCPRCGSANACTLPGSNPAAFACWCQAVRLPAKSQPPLVAERAGCLCAACLEAIGAEGVFPTRDPGGRAALRLRHGRHSALIALCGAQVLDFRDGDTDLLWTAGAASYLPGKPVRGGIPLVFPWFGDHPTDTGKPAHGFARNLDWQLAQATAAASIELVTDSNTATLRLWPHHFRLRFGAALQDAGLELFLQATNTDAAPWRGELALHSYFAVGDVHTASVHGLENVPFTEHAAAPAAGIDPMVPLRFTAETDRIYQGVPPRIAIAAPALDRRLLLESNASSAIVWNPWAAKAARLPQLAAGDWQHFVCVESGDVRQAAWTLQPGESRRLTLRMAAADGAGR